MKKIRILTFHYVVNTGAILQTYSLCNALQEKFDTYDVKILDYKSTKLELYGLLKTPMMHKKVPFFNISRHIKFKKFIKENLELDKRILRSNNYNKLVEFLGNQNYDMIVVGSDAIWMILEDRLFPKFPNIYWLSNKISSKKVAYAACAAPSNINTIKDNRWMIRDCLNSFDLIGVRDDFTMDLVKNCDITSDISVLKIPDPSFLYEIKKNKTNVDRILTNSGIDLDKPILGILIYGMDEFSKSIRDYFKSKGYQIIALSMYNPYADLNLGHILDPFEWAEIFKYLTFCITDRFHGAIFCLKNKIPFVSIELKNIKSINESRKFSLLNDFDMLECYVNSYSEDFDINIFKNKCSNLIDVWGDRYMNKIDIKLKEMENMSYDFIERMWRLENV